MIDMLRQKLAELEAGMQQLQRDRRQLDNAIAMQNGAIAFAKEMLAEAEQAEKVDGETPEAEAE